MELERLKKSRFFTRPLERIEAESIALDQDFGRIKERLAHRLFQDREKTKMLFAHLSALSPEAILKRGYSIVYKKNGAAVMSSVEVENGEQIEIYTGNGRFAARREDKTAEK